MPIYQVTPLANNAAALGAAIAEHISASDFYPLMNNAGWLIEHKGTTLELSAAIGITGHPSGETSKIGSALVVPVTSYYGIAPSDMWEWLKIRLERQ